MVCLQIKNKTFIKQLLYLYTIGSPLDYQIVMFNAGEAKQISLDDNLGKIYISDRTPSYHFSSQDKNRLSQNFGIISN